MRVGFADGIKNDTDLEDSNPNDNDEYDAKSITSIYQLTKDNLEYHIRAAMKTQRSYYGAKGIRNIKTYAI